MKNSEPNFKKDFCLQYFDKGCWQLDILNKVDVLLTDKRQRVLLYIESKVSIVNETEHRRAIAQVILTNRKQEEILSRVALIYQNAQQEDVLELVDCSDNSVMFNNDINWEKEKASEPSRDAIDRINDRVAGKVRTFVGEKEIKAAYAQIKKGQDAFISITERNFIVVYNHWRQEVRFHERIDDEQDYINLFLVDLLNRETYKEVIEQDVVEQTLFGEVKKGTVRIKTDNNLFREGTDLLNYRIMFDEGVIDGIKYKGYPKSFYYTIEDKKRYDAFWSKYKRPPRQEDFMKIKEYSSMLYSEKYRRDTGGEYTPSCFVAKQNEFLRAHYNMDDFIVCDPCAGVGNLENEFGKDFKQYCYLSTLVHMDVDTCRIKGFDNTIQYDFFSEQDEFPKWKYKGVELDIREIAKREGRRLMVIMNPPYVRRKGFENDMAIEFFKKVLSLEPDVIVYYCKTEFLLRDTARTFARSGYKIVSHIFSNAQKTFKLSEWPVSQIIFDRERGEEFTGEYVKADRYELNRRTQQLEYVRTYCYDNVRPSLLKDIERVIKSNAVGMRLGQWTNDHYCVVVSNRRTHAQSITTENLRYTLLLKGINFNTHGRYFETSNLTYKGVAQDVSNELLADAIMFALFYKGFNFSNKEGERNYLVPFTAEELRCAPNCLNVLSPLDCLADTAQTELVFDEGHLDVPSFDFREWMRQFEFSDEARELYDAALGVFAYYHGNETYTDKDWNDSFYDITNAIMGKDPAGYQEVATKRDRRITRVKTAKGVQGFSRSAVRRIVRPEDIHLFDRFFDARDILARKINRLLVEQKLLLWERENIY